MQPLAGSFPRLGQHFRLPREVLCFLLQRGEVVRGRVAGRLWLGISVDPAMKAEARVPQSPAAAPERSRVPARQPWSR